MNSKPWWKRSTTWGLALVAVAEAAKRVPETAPFSELLTVVGGLVAANGIRNAQGRIEAANK